MLKKTESPLRLGRREFWKVRLCALGALVLEFSTPAVLRLHPQNTLEHCAKHQTFLWSFTSLREAGMATESYRMSPHSVKAPAR